MMSAATTFVKSVQPPLKSAKSTDYKKRDAYVRRYCRLSSEIGPVGAPGVSSKAVRAVLAAVADFVEWDAGTGAWPSISTLSERTGSSKRSVIRAIRALKEQGFLFNTESRGHGKSICYDIANWLPGVEAVPLSEIEEHGLESPAVVDSIDDAETEEIEQQTAEVISISDKRLAAPNIAPGKPVTQPLPQPLPFHDLTPDISPINPCHGVTTPVPWRHHTCAMASPHLCHGVTQTINKQSIKPSVSGGVTRATREAKTPPHATGKIPVDFDLGKTPVATQTAALDFIAQVRARLGITSVNHETPPQTAAQTQNQETAPTANRPPLTETEISVWFYSLGASTEVEAETDDFDVSGIDTAKNKWFIGYLNRKTGGKENSHEQTTQLDTPEEQTPAPRPEPTPSEESESVGPLLAGVHNQLKIDDTAHFESTGVRDRIAAEYVAQDTASEASGATTDVLDFENVASINPLDAPIFDVITRVRPWITDRSAKYIQKMPLIQEYGHCLQLLAQPTPPPEPVDLLNFEGDPGLEPLDCETASAVRAAFKGTVYRGVPIPEGATRALSGAIEIDLRAVRGLGVAEIVSRIEALLGGASDPVIEVWVSRILRADRQCAEYNLSQRAQRVEREAVESEKIAQCSDRVTAAPGAWLRVFSKKMATELGLKLSLTAQDCDRIQQVFQDETDHQNDQIIEYLILRYTDRLRGVSQGRCAPITSVATEIERWCDDAVTKNGFYSRALAYSSKRKRCTL